MEKVNKILYNQYYNNVYHHRYGYYHRGFLYFNLIIKKRDELNGVKSYLRGPAGKLFYLGC